jgi:hypothetical protein
VNDINPLRPEPLYHGGRFVCRPETPWNPNVPGLACHPQAKVVGGGDYHDTYQCPVCGLRFSVELPV